MLSDEDDDTRTLQNSLRQSFDESDVRPVIVRQQGKVFAAVEGGGTTFRVALAHGDPANITECISIDTTTPTETLGKVCGWLRQRSYDAIGIASFGPVDLNRGSPSFGYVTSTPKAGWANTDVVGPILAASPPGIPFEFDTDVNAPCMAEFTLGGLRQQGCSSCAYVTVGTGIGVGLVVNGQCVHGLVHPEAGHVPLPPPRDKGDPHPPLKDRLVYGGAESLCCAKAIAVRAGVQTSDLAALPDDHEAFDYAAFYLAGLCVDLILIASPERIILSGGVMQRGSLFPAIRRYVQESLNGYLQHPSITHDIDSYIRPSAWGNNAGIIGALALAQLALLKEEQSQALGVSAAAPADGRANATGYGYVQVLFVSVLLLLSLPLSLSHAPLLHACLFTWRLTFLIHTPSSCR